MKRDLDLCRHLLKSLEALKLPQFDGEVSDLAKNHDPAVVMFHIKLLCDNGLATMVDDPGEQAVGLVRGLRLTANGCDFMDAIRDDSAFNKLKEEIKRRWPDIAIAFAVKLLGL